MAIGSSRGWVTSRSDLDALLKQLELDISYIVDTGGVNGVFREFEDRSEMILGVAEDAEQEKYVLDCLIVMFRKSSVPDGFKGPRLH
jgi:hypothetical protein